MNNLTKFVITLPLFLPIISFAAGIQVSPASLNIIVSPKEETTQSFTVANPTADVQIFELDADDYPKYIQPIPKSFTLESGARKVISLKIIGLGPLEKADQKLTTNLSIVSKPLSDTDLSIGAGVKLPLEITISKGGRNNGQMVILAEGLSVLILIMCGYIYVKKRSGGKPA